MIKGFCPNPDCAASYSIADEQVGRTGRCKHCGRTFALVPNTRSGGEPLALPDLDAGGADEAREEELPSPFGRFRIIQRLGKGGMGAVYLAHDTQLDRPVALKVPHRWLRDDRETRERFLREARAAARFHHANFC